MRRREGRTAPDNSNNLRHLIRSEAATYCEQLQHWCGNHFGPEEKARAFYYYEALTVRDSSLSACTQAIVAAEVGQLELAHDYLREAALMDLHNLENNTRDGLHIASLGRRLAGAGRRFRWHA